MPNTHAWLAKQSENAQAHIRRHLAGDFAKTHQSFLVDLASHGKQVSPDQYDGLSYLWSNLPTKRFFELALYQGLDKTRCDLLLMAAEMGIYRHGIEVFGSGGQRYAYADAVARVEAEVRRDTPLSDAHELLHELHEKHQHLERLTYYGSRIPEHLWSWYCSLPVDVQEYLRRTACFHTDDLVGNGDEFWHHGSHFGLTAWLEQCAANNRTWPTGEEMHQAFVTEAPSRKNSFARLSANQDQMQGAA